MKAFAAFVMTALLLGCAPGTKSLYGKYHIKITSEMEKEFQAYDQRLAKERERNPDLAAEAEKSHPRRVARDQSIEIFPDNTYRYWGLNNGIETIVEGTVTVNGDKVTLTPSTESGMLPNGMPVVPLTYTHDLEAGTLSLEGDSSLIWTK